MEEMECKEEWTVGKVPVGGCEGGGQAVIII